MTKKKAVMIFKAYIEIEFDDAKMERKKYSKKYIIDHILGTFDSFKKNRVLKKVDYVLNREVGNATDFIKEQLEWKKKHSKPEIEFNNVKYIPASFSYVFKRQNGGLI